MTWLGALVACGPSPPGHVPGDSAPDVPDVPWIDEALAERCPDPTPTSSAPAGTDLHLATLTDAAARCNDGSPPVAWIRQGDAEHAGDWVIHLDGGSYCGDTEGCAERWCGEGFYDASKMSSRWAAETRGGQGIQSPSADNAFAAYNHVFVHYCSSDLWAGTNPDHVWDGDPPYRVANQGHDIVLAVLDHLDDGLVSDDGAMALPALGSAETVLFSGSSAGGYGAGIHLGVVADHLPGVQVIGLPDAIFTRPYDAMAPEAAATLELEQRRLWDEVMVGPWLGFVDEGCTAARPADDAWRCIDLDPVLRGATVPWLLHHDLRDGTLYQSYDAALSEAEFAALGADTLRRYFDELPHASVHGTACGEHTALDGNASFLRMSVQGVTLHDAVRAVVAGQRVLAVDVPEGDGSICDGL